MRPDRRRPRPDRANAPTSSPRDTRRGPDGSVRGSPSFSTGTGSCSPRHHHVRTGRSWIARPRVFSTWHGLHRGHRVRGLPPAVGVAPRARPRTHRAPLPASASARSRWTCSRRLHRDGGGQPQRPRRPARLARRAGGLRRCWGSVRWERRSSCPTACCTNSPPSWHSATSSSRSSTRCRACHWTAAGCCAPASGPSPRPEPRQPGRRVGRPGGGGRRRAGGRPRPIRSGYVGLLGWCSRSWSR
jgi:hypothetical protein